MSAETAPSAGEIMSAFRIRDELATCIVKVKGAADFGRNATVGKSHAKLIAEALIAQGLIDVGRIHREIIDDAQHGDEDALDDVEEEPED